MTTPLSPFQIAARKGQGAQAQPQPVSQATAPAEPAFSAAASMPAQAAAAAIPAEVASTHASAQEAGPDVKVHVLLDAGHSQLSRLLGGVVGTADEQDRFQIDPDYRQLSYLFTLAQSGQMPLLRDQALDANIATEGTDGPVQWRVGERSLELTMPKDLAAQLKVNLIEVAARGWDTLYDGFGSSLGQGLGGGMLAAERAAVAGAVAQYLEAQGTPMWDVPVIYRTTVFEEDPQQRPRQEAALLAMAHPTGPLLPDVTRPPVEHAVPAEPAVTTAATDAGEIEAPSNLPREWVEHVGTLDLVVEGSLRVLARTAEDAAAIAGPLARCLSTLPQLRAAAQVRAHAVQQATLNAPTPAEDDNYPTQRY